MTRWSLAAASMMLLMFVPSRSVAANEAAFDLLSAPGILTWEQREARADGFRDAAIATARGNRLLQDFERTSREQIAAKGSECVETLRRSNRDTKLPTALLCYRSIILMQRDRVSRMQQFIENAPGITVPVQADALHTGDELIDAIETIAVGIDSDVFGSTEELLETKTQLFERYWMPYWLQLNRIRADRLQSWISHLLVRINGIPRNVRMSTEETIAIRQGGLCLGQGEFFLQEILDMKDYEESNYLFSQALIHLQSCSDLLRNALNPEM